MHTHSLLVYLYRASMQTALHRKCAKKLTFCELEVHVYLLKALKPEKFRSSFDYGHKFIFASNIRGHIFAVFALLKGKDSIGFILWMTG